MICRDVLLGTVCAVKASYLLSLTLHARTFFVVVCPACPAPAQVLLYRKARLEDGDVVARGTTAQSGETRIKLLVRF